DGVSAPSGVAMAGRLLAHVGIAIRDWVSYFGAALNVNPDLGPFRRVGGPADFAPMTSLERERRITINPALVRQHVIERFMERFEMLHADVHHEHPALPAARMPIWPELPVARTWVAPRHLAGVDSAEA